MSIITGKTDADLRLEVYDALGDHRNSLSPLERGRLDLIVGTRDTERIDGFVADVIAARAQRGSGACQVCGRDAEAEWCGPCILADHQQAQERY